MVVMLDAKEDFRRNPLIDGLGPPKVGVQQSDPRGKVDGPLTGPKE